MTQEQNAEEYASSIVERDYHEDLWLDLRDAHIAGAHSRDEEIYNLKRDIEDLQKMVKMRSDAFECARKDIDRLSNPWISVEDGLPPLDETRDIHEEMVYPNLSIEVVLSDGNRVIGGIYNYGRKDWSYDFPMLESFAPKFWMSILQPKGGEK